MKIVAIVISFNRLEMVQRCVASLRAQTRKLDAILVVDSSTQPDVRVWLETQSDVQRMFVGDEGAAGGMHHGLKWALAHDFDWMWLFDDDVVAAPDALTQLGAALEIRPGMMVLNALSLGEQDRTVPAVGGLTWRSESNDYLRGHRLTTANEIRAHADADGLLDTVGGQMYQGTLIHRSVVSRVGAPFIELFMRGEEVEYGLRIMRTGYHIHVCVHSIVTHPNNRIRFVSVLGRKYPCVATTPFKRYYNVRNSLYVKRKYYGERWLFAYALRRVVGCVLTDLMIFPQESFRGRYDALRAILRGAWDGWFFDPPQLAAPQRDAVLGNVSVNARGD